MGYMCDEDVTTDLDAPLVRAAAVRPRLDRPLPYAYGFVRATAPQYLQVPTRKQQLASELQLEEHLAWYEEHRAEVQTVVRGANDVLLDSRGVPSPRAEPAAGHRESTSLSLLELFGAATPAGELPEWLAGGRRAVPNVSAFQVPEYAVFADRVRRKTGLSFVGAFLAEDDGLARPFGITVDLRLIPLTKVKPDTGSAFHGLDLRQLELPIAFVSRSGARAWHLRRGRDETVDAGEVPYRAVVPLTGKARIKAGKRHYQTRKDPKLWLRAEDLGIVAPPPTWPEAAEKGEKWIDVSLVQQTLVLWEGKRPFYATLVSTGRDRLGDPKTSLATPRGEFRLQSKHVAAAMDSEENSAVAGGTRSARSGGLSAEHRALHEKLEADEAAGRRLSDEDRRRLLNLRKGRHPEYGVTVRRGAANFELRDVPWIQYFAAGYALHGAYWHDVFGAPRSHGCINLAPADARVVFQWTDPPLPAGWHGVNIGSDMGLGTPVVVRE
ncbi:MAG: L,D-transpeptidase [Polyangiaceae bacterium]|nr:L,D-transpeptidase [Polyangiaceae bacterium]